jgi:hypothetical protein
MNVTFIIWSRPQGRASELNTPRSVAYLFKELPEDPVQREVVFGAKHFSHKPAPLLQKLCR